MSQSEDIEAYYATLGLPPDATMAQVKARYRELNDAYLKILESSRRGGAGESPRHVKDGGDALQEEQRPKADPGRKPPQHETDTEPIKELKERLANGKIDKARFEELAKARYRYLQHKPFSELSDSEFEERLSGFEGLKIDLR